MDSKGRRVVLITGGARGIGRAIGLCLAGLGDHVVLTDIDQEQAEATAVAARGLAGTATALPLDVRDRGLFQSVVEQVESDIGPIDVLINNAGIMPIGPFEQMEAGLEQAQFDINVRGVLNGLHAVLPRMRERGQGHVITMASLAGRVPLPNGAVYSSAKFAVVGLTESLRHEYRESGIHFSTIQPMLVATDLASGIPAPKWPKPVSAQDVAKAVVKTLNHPKRLVYVPAVGRVFAVLPWVIPDRVGVGLAKMLGGWEVFSNVDAQHRASYRKRNSEL